MRIISGEFGGRRLSAVPGMQTRPTTDKVKEAMFNILNRYPKEGQVLDLYSGSGGLGIEAVSRGYNHAFLVDHQYAAIKTIKSNVAVTKHSEQFTILKMDAFKALQYFAKQQQQFSLVLLDPPYKQQKIMKILTILDQLHLLTNNAIVLAETDTTVDYQTMAHYELVRQQKYGITLVTVFHYIGNNHE